MEKNFNRYPFSAIVGQPELKKALILNLIDDSIGGILIVGEKGVSKSTIVRGIEDISNKKIIELPLNTTEDMFMGAIDIEETLKIGNIIKTKSLLERAENNILYVDEVNLLEDRLTDILLTSTESVVQENQVMKNKFILIGTMNKEEGELRNEFLDRFPMYIDVKSDKDIAVRKDIMMKVIEFEKNKRKFIKKYVSENLRIKNKIEQAKKILCNVKIDSEKIKVIVKLCIDYGVEGHRADIYMRKVAMAIAAYNLEEVVSEEHVLEAATYVLPHRLTKFPEDEDVEEKQNDEEVKNNEIDDKTKPNNDNNYQNQDKKENSETYIEQQKNKEREDDNKENEDRSNNDKSSEEVQVFSVGSEVELKEFLLDKDNKKRSNDGRRIMTNSKDRRGRCIRTSSKVINNDIALAETIRYAAPYQRHREKNGLAIKINKDDLRGKVRKRKSSSFIVFVVDSSGSLGANKRMVEVKGAVLSILKDAYVKRDYVSLVLARGLEAEAILPKTNSVERGYRLLKEIKTGGKTPLNDGLIKGLEVIKRECRLDDSLKPILVIISDGKGNVSINKSLKPKEEMLLISNEIKRNTNIKTVVLDVEKKGMMSFGLAKKLSEMANAQYIHIENLKKTDILNSINKVRK